LTSILVVNRTGNERRVALVEDGVLREIHLERGDTPGLVGNVYLGKVSRVLPGMQAAFIDFGAERSGFLYVSDVHTDHCDPATSDSPPVAPLDPEVAQPLIQDQLRDGQELVVQVSKDPIGTKGARLTCHISLPGRYLVYMPTADHVGISRRIEEEEERERLREIVLSHRPAGSGFIVRTACVGVSDKRVIADMEMLIGRWTGIVEQRRVSGPPFTLHAEHDLLLRSARDLFSAGLGRIVVDDAQDHQRLVTFSAARVPGATDNIQLYEGESPIFDAYGVEKQLRKAMSQKVRLKSGGYLVIEHTEAMTCIDVNSGRYVGKRTLEDTFLKLNLEAVGEIVRQLEVRNVGGLIVIDFIDMERDSSRQQVYGALTSALDRDKARSKILEFSDFGLVEMTRKRVRESLVQFLCDECPYCEGKGYVTSAETVAYEIIRAILRDDRTKGADVVRVRLHPAVASVLTEDEATAIENLSEALGFDLELATDSAFHIETYVIEFEDRGQ
jgi:ribonuclease G